MSTTSPKSDEPKKHLNAFKANGDRVHASAHTNSPKAMRPGATAPPAIANHTTALMLPLRVDGVSP